MNPQDVIDIVQKIGELLSPLAQQAYSIAMRRALTDIIIGSILLGALSVVAIVILASSLGKLKAIDQNKRDEDRDYRLRYSALQDSKEACQVWVVITAIVFPLAITAFAFVFSSFWNLEWAAIQYLLQFAK